MSALVQVGGGSPNAAVADVVFVHGIQGDPRGTWTNKNGGFWPYWLAEDNAGLAVWSAGYKAAISEWAGTAMPLFDRANNVLAELQAAGIGGRPICWVTHSMGGLLVKKMLRNADSIAAEFRSLSDATRGVVFIGTPHTGSDLASLARYLGSVLRLSAAAKDLQPLSAQLLELNIWYRENHRRLGVATQVYFETQTTKGVWVVDRGTADPGLEGVIPIGLDADHLSICKPSGKDDLIYKRTMAFIRRVVAPQTANTDGRPKVRAHAVAVPGHRDSTASRGRVRRPEMGHPRLVMGTGPPLIEERLDLEIVDGGIQSIRETPGQPRAIARLAFPSDKDLEDYRIALAKTAALTDLPNDYETIGPMRKLVHPLRETLLQAVPEEVRQRMIAEGAGPVRKLVTIELRLKDSRLEAYPWELIAEPAALCKETTSVSVWRSVPSSPGVPERWTGNVLLTGMSVMGWVGAFAHDELAWINGELSGHPHLEAFSYPNISSNFKELLEKHRPAAFHLTAHAASESSQFQTEHRLIFKELGIHHKSLARELRRYGVWIAVFNCCDSATAPPDESRPPAYEIAEGSGAVTIGMAGLLQPYMGGLFATTFYRCLARGFSAVQAYYEAICRIRDHDIYSTMWSVPVMYASTSNVIPFPADDEARARLGIEQIRLHVKTLDLELQDLAAENFGSSGEWADQAATPILRTECIRSYLTAVVTARPAAVGDGRRRQRHLDKARDDLRSAMCATATALARLGDPDVGAPERRALLRELPRHRTRHQDVLETLDNLLGKGRRRTPFIRIMIRRCRCWVDAHEWMPNATERDTPSPGAKLGAILLHRRAQPILLGSTKRSAYTAVNGSLME
jgi:hypothetical protein